MEALIKIALSGKSDSARVAAATAISIARLEAIPNLRTESVPKVSYFMSDRLLTVELEAKH